MKQSVRVIGGALLLTAGMVSAQEAAQRSASDSAAAFTLNGMSADEPPAVPPVDAATLPEAEATAPAADTSTSPAPVATADAAPLETPAPAKPSRFTLDTPIAELIADPRSRRILDREMPGLSTDENLDKFRSLSLRKFQPLTGGQLTDALLAKLAADLAAIPSSRPRSEGR